MRQAILYGARDLRLEERALDDGKLQPNQVYVETEVTALSTGTDLANYLGRSTEIPGAPDYPRAVGYSNVGVIRRAGAAVRACHAGQRVFSMKPHQSAYIASEAELLVPVPGCVAAEETSLAYLAQLGLAALQQARCEAGDTVAVVGLGVIGLCAVGVARALGARVFAVANSRPRAELALRLGAEDGGSDADIVVLTANTWDAYRTAVEIARPYGRISILGFPGRAQPEPDFNPFDPSWFYGKSLTLIAAGKVGSALGRNLECILGWMASGALRLEPVISHRLPADRMREAYELAAEHDKSLTGAVFDWRT